MDKNSNKLVNLEADAAGAPEVTVVPNGSELVLGAWYWVKSVARSDNAVTGHKEGDEYEWFGCAMQIGSNYIEIHSPHGSYTRVHLDDYWTRLRREADPDTVIAEQVEHWQSRAKELVAEIRNVSQRLGVARSRAIAGPSGERETSGSALVTLSGQADLNAYRTQLTVAKETTLPALHESLKAANGNLKTWMQASILSLEATTQPLRETIETINDRLFSFGLYAGLAEQAIECCKGAAASYDEPLHVMQRRLYMDEEALLSYEAGGMDFRSLDEFDAWLCRPENRDRILPFPRTLVAMRVRRSAKERETHGDVLATFIRIQEEEADKWTFLYVRNGEQVWRIACEIDFGEMIFPDGAIYREGEPMMVKMSGNAVDKLITRAEYDVHLAAYRAEKARSKAWRRANPDKDAFWDPHRRDEIYIEGFGYFRPREWDAFDRQNVHFDEVMESLDAKIKEHNRVAVIIQGLFDRSEILHPHPVVQTWRPDSFACSVKLVYDASSALTAGEKPDFEAFRAELNQSLGVGSVVVGQEHFWMAREAEKENARRDKDPRTGATRYRYDLFAPHNNPGPGRVCTIENWKPRSRAAVFAWEREGRRYNSHPVGQTLSVPATALLNITAYKPGDFKRFFADPRTRAEYLQWAPLLLTAEDWHSGKLRTDAPRNRGSSRLY